MVRPRCKYGEKCFRQNENHRAQYCHPGDPDWDSKPVSTDAAPVPQQDRCATVTLHIYDVSTDSRVGKINEYLEAMGTGAFHGGVEVDGEEWSYGYNPDGTGVFKCPPKGCTAHVYREPVDMGTTNKTPQEIEDIITQLKGEWPGFEYDLLRRNCVIFSSTFCTMLGCGSAPSWVTNLAGAGATLSDGFGKASAAANSAAIIAAAKAGEIDAQYDISGKAKAGAKEILTRAGKFDEEYKVREKTFKAAVFAKSKAIEAHAAAKDKAAAIHAEADDDGDGQISWEEAKDFLREKAERTPDIVVGKAQDIAAAAKIHAAALHRAMDKDGDGRIDMDEALDHAKMKASACSESCNAACVVS